ncbi:MAG: hypothetical protein EBT03_07830 [Betaproteobacteria bacterium]|nr:hypothetical protein [Betaproteobacteria bacterium]
MIPTMVPHDRIYVVRYISRNWIGKPDPSGFGKYEIIYRDPSAAHEEAMRLVSQGHKIIGIFLERKGA